MLAVGRRATCVQAEPACHFYCFLLKWFNKFYFGRIHFTMTYNLTQGKIAKSLIGFSLPMICGNILQQFYNVADTLIVGRTIGATALSAVGSSYALMVLLTSLILGLCMGSGVVFSQLWGAGRKDEMKTCIFNGLIFIFAVTVVINILSFLLLENFIVWLNIPSEAVDFTREYLRVIFTGIIFVYIYNFFASVLRSVGNTLVPLIFLAVSAVLNIVLDIVFIVSFSMGVEGAALATVIAQGVSAAAITIYFFLKGKDICPAKTHMHLGKRYIKMILSNSLLTAVQQSVMNLGILMVQGLVNSFGFAVSAAFAAVVKIDAFAYMPAQDFGNAFSTFVAQNYGAGKKNRINQGYKTALLISSVFCALSSACVFIFASPLMKLFVKAEETEIITIGVGYLRTEGVFYIGIGILFLLYGLYRSIGKPSVSLVLTVISLGLRVALAYILSAIPELGILGIWISVPIGWAVADIFGVVLYRIKLEKYLPEEA